MTPTTSTLAHAPRHRKRGSLPDCSLKVRTGAQCVSIPTGKDLALHLNLPLASAWQKESPHASVAVMNRSYFAPSLQFPYGEATEVMEVEEMVNLEIGPLPQHLFLEQVYRMPLLRQLAPLLPSLTKSPFFLGTTRFVVASFMSVPHCQSLAEPVHSCLGCEWALTALLDHCVVLCPSLLVLHSALGRLLAARSCSPPRDGAQLLPGA